MKQVVKIKLSILGGGPANLLTAYMLSKTGIFDITIYEQGKRLGRKFLVAGNGGFNLSHEGKLNDLKSNYNPKGILDESIELFDNKATIDWLKEIGIETYYGSSGRLFPKQGIKPIEVINKLLEALVDNGVQIKTNHKFVGIEKNGVIIESQGIKSLLLSDYYVYGFGGKSWKKTGSDGNWVEIFEGKGVRVDRFFADNVGVNINWAGAFINTYDRTPLKNISVSHNGITQTGEALITDFGLEGNAIYPLSGNIVRELFKKNKSIITIDFKPMWIIDKLKDKLRSKIGNTSKKLKGIGIPSVVIQLMRSKLNREEWLDMESISQCLKAFQLDVVGHQDIDVAISTQGGISINQIDKNFQLVDFPNHYCNGEMINWTAPTGGYLLQACFSIGNKIALDIISKES